MPYNPEVAFVRLVHDGIPIPRKNPKKPNPKDIISGFSKNLILEPPLGVHVIFFFSFFDDGMKNTQFFESYSQFLLWSIMI